MEDHNQVAEQEIEAFMIVRAIGARFVAAERFSVRQADNCCIVYVGNNDGMPICGFFFKSATEKSVLLFLQGRRQVRYHVEDPSDILTFYREIETVVKASMQYA